MNDFKLLQIPVSKCIYGLGKVEFMKTFYFGDEAEELIEEEDNS